MNIVENFVITQLYLFVFIVIDQVVADVTLDKVLNFVTGSEYPPPLGFDDPISINFSSSNVFPIASTCASQLTLPLVYFNNEGLFKEKVIYAVMNHGGFGNM